MFSNDAGVFFDDIVGSSEITQLDSSTSLVNLGLDATVAANALTILLKTKAGSDPSGGSKVQLGFRSVTIGDGIYNLREVTSALSAVVSSGSTLGHDGTFADFIYIYLIDNAGTVELAFSTSKRFDEGKLHSTTAEGGAGAADGRYVLYSTTARANVPIRLVGRMLSTQSTAGLYAAVPSEIAVQPFPAIDPHISARYTRGSSQTIPNSSTTKVNFDVSDWDTNSAVTTGAGWMFTAPEKGRYEISATVLFDDNATGHREISIFKGGALYLLADFTKSSGSATDDMLQVPATMVELDQGEFLDLRVFQNSGGNLDIDARAGLSTSVNIKRIMNGDTPQ